MRRYVCNYTRQSRKLMRYRQTDEENIALARPYVERAAKCGIAVEVELGRLEGGEAGLRMISDAKLTRPEKALEFMEGCIPYRFSHVVAY